MPTYSWCHTPEENVDSNGSWSDFEPQKKSTHTSLQPALTAMKFANNSEPWQRVFHFFPNRASSELSALKGSNFSWVFSRMPISDVVMESLTSLLGFTIIGASLMSLIVHLALPNSKTPDPLMKTLGVVMPIIALLALTTLIIMWIVRETEGKKK
jgi:hypothetical protein